MTNDEVLFLVGQVTGALLRMTAEELERAASTPGLKPENATMIRLAVAHCAALETVKK